MSLQGTHVTPFVYDENGNFSVAPDAAEAGSWIGLVSPVCQSNLLHEGQEA